MGHGDVGEIYYNIFSHNGGDGLLLKGKVSGKMYNNVIYSNRQHGILLAGTPGPAPSNVVLKNNIIMNNGIEVKVAKEVAEGFTSDYNCIYHSGSGKFMHWSGTDYNWESWKSHSKQDTHSINKDPLFDKEKDNFRLTIGSPCINNGSDVALKGTDYYGNPIPDGKLDIGVHEMKIPQHKTPAP
jgi:hypothetical protein